MLLLTIKGMALRMNNEVLSCDPDLLCIINQSNRVLRCFFLRKNKKHSVFPRIFNQLFEAWILPAASVSARGRQESRERAEKPGGVLLGILGGGVPPSSLNPDQKMSFYRPVFRPELQNPFPFSDLAFRQKLRHRYLDSECANKRNSSDAFRIRIFLLRCYIHLN